MPDAYYRISANQSEADETLYQHGKMIVDLKKVAPTRKDMIPKFSDVRKTHRLPFKPEYKPIILMSNDLVKHTTNVSSFTTGYNGDVQCQMYLKIAISTGTVAAGSGVAASGEVPYWSFVRNFVPGLIKKVNFKVQGDIITEATGAVLFLYSQWFVSSNQRPALLRLWRESIGELVLKAGKATPTNATAAAANVNARRDSVRTITSWEVFTPHYSLLEPLLSRPAFTLFVPLDVLSLTRSLEDSFPLAPLYALERKVEFEYNALNNLVNVWFEDTDGSEADGWVDPQFGTSGTVVNWTATPAVTSTELYVNYILVHRDLQRVMSMNGYGYVIHQYASENVTVETNTSRELSYTKVVEWIGILGRFTHHTAHTATGAVAAHNTGGTALETPFTYRLDPFTVDTAVNPIDTIDVVARGQTFYQSLTWDEVSSALGYHIGGKDFHSSAERSIGLIPFSQRVSMEEFMGSYNSGYGPNLTLKWASTAFDKNTSDFYGYQGATVAARPSGVLTFILFCANTFAAFRGTSTIRYT